MLASAPAPNAKRVCTPPPSSLTGIAAVQSAFLFLDGPADVLRASAANHRWRELARDDSLWRVKARREGILKKARMFEVPLPSATGDDASIASSSGGGSSGAGGGGGGGGGGAAEDKEDEALLGVGLAFYAKVFALKVRAWCSCEHTSLALTVVARLPPAAVVCSAGAQDEGRGLAGVSG